MGYGRNSPPGTCATNEIKIITGLGKAGKGWLTLAFALHVLLDRSPCIISLMMSSSESPPPSVQRLLVSERHLWKEKKKTHLPRASSFNGGFAPDEDMIVKRRRMPAGTNR